VVATDLAVAPAAPAVLAEAAARLRELPAFDPADIPREVGFVRAVRRLVAIPLGLLGLLAVAGAVLSGSLVPAAAAAVITVLLQITLFDDVRLAHALDLVRRGDMPGADRHLRALAEGDRAGQRQRACIVLAALAYRQGELQDARAWACAAADLERGRRGGDAVARFFVLVSEVLVLAMSGSAEAARGRLAELPPAPPGDELAKLWRVHVALLCAFVGGEVELVESQLDDWAPLVRRMDTVGPTAALLAWAFAATGRHDAAAQWIEHALHRGDESVLRTRYAAVMSALDSFTRKGHYARR